MLVYLNEVILEQNGFTLWFTGLSGSGKTTLSKMVYKDFKQRGFKAELIDGDLVRQIFSKGLTFSKEDRDIHIRRLGYFSSLLSKNGVIAIVAAIAPYREIRDANRSLINNYYEIYTACPLKVLEKRDVKGLYKKAKLGEIKHFTGISAPYEEPLHPYLSLNTDKERVDESFRKIIRKLEKDNIVITYDRCIKPEYCLEEDQVFYNKLMTLEYLSGGGDQRHLKQ
jgi:adenylylsulfate kinase